MKAKNVLFATVLTLGCIAQADGLTNQFLHDPEQLTPTQQTKPILLKTDALKKALCGDENKHIDCEKVLPAITNFNKELASALPDLLLNEEKGFRGISRALQNLAQSKEGFKKEVSDNKCSVNDGVGEDIWARDADKVLKEIETSQEIKNTAIIGIARLEQMNTLDLMKPLSDTKDEEMRKAVLANRIEMYGQKLQLNDAYVTKLIKSFGETMQAGTAEKAKEAGKILAVYLDSMSILQKTELKHFANSFAKSSVDRDFKEAIQLAMNNWSQNKPDLKPEVSADDCFTSNIKEVANLKTGFLEAMQKDVASNRQDFWQTVDQASQGDETAKKKLISKWGKSLPAYMQSLKEMAKNGSEAEESRALDRLNKITKAIGTEAGTDSGKTTAKISLASKDEKKPDVVDITKTQDSSDKEKISSIDWKNDLRNGVLVETKQEAIAKAEPKKEEPKEETSTGEKSDSEEKQNPGAPDLSEQAELMTALLKNNPEVAATLFKEAAKGFLLEPGRWDMYKTASDTVIPAISEELLKRYPSFSNLSDSQRSDLVKEAKEEIAQNAKVDLSKKTIVETPKAVTQSATIAAKPASIPSISAQSIAEGNTQVVTDQKLLANPMPQFNSPELTQTLNHRALHNSEVKLESERDKVLADIKEKLTNGAKEADLKDLRQQYADIQVALQKVRDAQINTRNSQVEVPKQSPKEPVKAETVNKPAAQKAETKLDILNPFMKPKKPVQSYPLTGHPDEVKGNPTLNADPTL